MIRYALRRLALALPVVWAVASAVFALVHLVPGDPVQMMLGEGASAADVENLRHSLGFDRPLGERYVAYLAGLLDGDLGRSLASGEPVARLLAQRLPATAELALASLVVALALALPLGVLAAVRRGGAADHLARGVALLGVSVPGFWLGPMLILLFAIRLDLLPVSGRTGLRSLVLLAVTLGAGMAGLLTRMVRTALAQELAKPYLLTARAKGIGAARAVLGHGLRNALLPVITVLGLQLGSLLAGAIVTETVFSWPGLGRLLVEAIRLRDYPVLQGAVLSIALVYAVVNLLTDLAYAWADPRVRLA